MVVITKLHSGISRWSTLPQWLTHQAAWWVCILGVGWVRPSSMVLFVALHLWFTRTGWRRELAMIGWAVGLGFLADSLLALSGAVVFEGQFRVGLVPLWMVSLWAGFGATLLHSHRPMLKDPRIAFILGALGGPWAYLGGQKLGCLAIGDGYSLVAIGLAWAVVLVILEHRLTVFERDGSNPASATK
jgi:hypothetical protein